MPSSARLPTSYPGIVSNVDLALLNKKLSNLDLQAIQRRRKVYNRLFHEAMLSADREKGLSFTDMLFLLAHYRLRQDDGALQVEELLQRQEKMRRVDDLVSLDKVRGLLSTMHYRKRFLDHRRSKHAEQNVPFIMIEESDTPRLGHLEGPFSPLSPASPASSLPGSPSLSPRTLTPSSPREAFNFSISADPLQEHDVLQGLEGSSWMRMAKNDDDD